MGSDKPFQIDLFGVIPLPATQRSQIRRPTPPRRMAGEPQVPGRDPADEAGMVERLEATGRYRVLRKLEPRPVAPELWPLSDRQPGSWPRLGIVLDTETTGLDHATHEIIELGMVAFSYDEAGVRDVVGVFSALQQPTSAITAEITRITGITDEMVAGQRIDLDVVQRFVEDADLIVAHNARFDRPFCEKLARLRRETLGVLGIGSGLDWTRLRGHEARLSRRPVRRLSQRTPSSRRLPCPSGSSHAFASHPGDAAVPAAAGVVTTGAPSHPRARLAVPHEGRSEGPRLPLE